MACCLMPHGKFQLLHPHQNEVDGSLKPIPFRKLKGACPEVVVVSLDRSRISLKGISCLVAAGLLPSPLEVICFVNLADY
jgi:hypothetical protein